MSEQPPPQLPPGVERRPPDITTLPIWASKAPPRVHNQLYNFNGVIAICVVTKRKRDVDDDTTASRRLPCCKRCWAAPTKRDDGRCTLCHKATAAATVAVAPTAAPAPTVAMPDVSDAVPDPATRLAAHLATAAVTAVGAMPTGLVAMRSTPRDWIDNPFNFAASPETTAMLRHIEVSTFHRIHFSTDKNHELVPFRPSDGCGWTRKLTRVRGVLCGLAHEMANKMYAFAHTSPERFELLFGDPFEMNLTKEECIQHNHALRSPTWLFTYMRLVQEEWDATEAGVQGNSRRRTRAMFDFQDFPSYATALISCAKTPVAAVAAALHLASQAALPETVRGTAALIDVAKVHTELRSHVLDAGARRVVKFRMDKERQSDVQHPHTVVENERPVVRDWDGSARSMAVLFLLTDVLASVRRSSHRRDGDAVSTDPLFYILPYAHGVWLADGLAATRHALAVREEALVVPKTFDRRHWLDADGLVDATEGRPIRGQNQQVQVLLEQSVRRALSDHSDVVKKGNAWRVPVETLKSIFG